MSAAPPKTDVHEQLDRSRACIDASRRIIARSRERIDDCLGAIAQGASGRTAARFELPARSQSSDEQQVAAEERGEAQRQQHAVDQEVRLSARELARRT